MQGKLEGALIALMHDVANEKAWEALYFELHAWIYAIAFRGLCGDTEGAQRVTQEVFIRLFKYCPFAQLLQEARFRGYVKSVANNATKDYIGTLVRERERSAQLEQWLESDDVAEQIGPDAGLLASDLASQLRGIVGEKDQQLLEWLVAGRTYDEIAAELDISKNAVAVRVHRIRDELRKRLEAAIEAEDETGDD